MTNEHKNLIPFSSNFADQEEAGLETVEVKPSVMLANRGKRLFMKAFVVGEDDTTQHIHSDSDPAALPHISESVINNETVNGNTNSMSSDEMIVSSTRDTVVVLITLTIIFLTLIASYFLWRKRRSSVSTGQCKLEEYRYSRLSQNDVEVDNISFQGDLTHKSLINPVPVCVDEDGEDERTKPATLCLQYDSLITMSNEDNSEGQRNSVISQSSTKSDDAPVNMLIDELSDEDLLQ